MRQTFNKYYIFLDFTHALLYLCRALAKKFAWRTIFGMFTYRRCGDGVEPANKDGMRAGALGGRSRTFGRRTEGKSS